MFLEPSKLCALGLGWWIKMGQLLNQRIEITFAVIEFSGNVRKEFDPLLPKF
jgi:hypothetical protein